jgi:hypothetical protein
LHHVKKKRRRRKKKEKRKETVPKLPIAGTPENLLISDQ